MVKLERSLNCVHVEQRLRGVLISPCAAVDDGNGPPLLTLQVIHEVAATLRKIWNLAPHDDQVEITGEHPDGVDWGFTFYF